MESFIFVRFRTKYVIFEFYEDWSNQIYVKNLLLPFYYDKTFKSLIKNWFKKCEQLRFFHGELRAFPVYCR
jgi:hypothetical protein